MMKLDFYDKELYVGLGSRIATERMQYFSTNAKIEEFSKPDGLIYYQIENLKDASLLCQAFIKQFRLGSSNWIGGNVYDKDFNFVAKVSYNGRLWDSENWKIANEILL